VEARTVEADGPGDLCAHVVPWPAGWDIGELVAWLGQGLELPDVDPGRWQVVVCRAGDCGVCDY
jgi:hypothetical protein